jgi:aminoglycoside phosphotransferase (APT) family kinase protein
MHADEIDTSAALVARLVRAQFPHWADLSLQRVEHAGTDHAIYRLGDELVVRMPRIEWATGQLEKERTWLPVLAPHVPLAFPELLAVGEPGEGYPWEWSVWAWIPGDNATSKHLDDPHEFARDLAAFIRALHGIDMVDGPRPSRRNFGRGAPLVTRDEETRTRIADCADEFDVDVLTAEWDAALAAPRWDRPGVWLHGDLKADNLIARDGRLHAVIDFGCLGVGDPAADVMAAWQSVPDDARNTFRAALDVDDATWTRARAWALSVSVLALPYYRETNPGLADTARRTITALLTEGV